MCFLCSSDPIEGDAFGARPNVFKVGMVNSCCEEPCWCLMGGFCLQPCACYMRYKVLGETLKGYQCCQGYFCGQGVCCFRPGKMGEDTCPCCCLCLEVMLCTGFAISANRMVIMDRFDLHSDPCDRRIIRCQNCLALLACICNILAIIDSSFRTIADLIQIIHEIVFATVAGCMTAQVVHEMKSRGVWDGPGAKSTAGAQTFIQQPIQGSINNNQPVYVQQQQQQVYVQQPQVYQQQQEGGMWHQQQYQQQQPQVYQQEGGMSHQQQYQQQPQVYQQQQQVVYVTQQPQVYQQTPQQYQQQPQLLNLNNKSQDVYVQR